MHPVAYAPFAYLLHTERQGPHREIRLDCEYDNNFFNINGLCNYALAHEGGLI